MSSSVPPLDGLVGIRQLHTSAPAEHSHPLLSVLASLHAASFPASLLSVLPPASLGLHLPITYQSISFCLRLCIFSKHG